MKIVEKIKEKQADLYSQRPITIAFLGDSVTQGCFECYEPVPNSVETRFYPWEAYCEKVKRILGKLYPSVPVNVINAGISGGSSGTGLKRLERDVLSYAPDLAVVCFGLNDVTGGEEGIGRFRDNLREIFCKIQTSGAECIYMSPNTMNDNISPDLTSDFMRKLAKGFSEKMQSGVMDKYMGAAIAEAESCGVTVCDCYSVWKNMSNAGVNTTELLANKLNHPDAEMLWVFAYELVKTMLAG